MNNEKLKRSLRQPEVPASLQQQLRDNWRTQLKVEAGYRWGGSRWLVGAVASVFVVFVALVAITQHGAPTIVTLAMQDIATDVQHHAAQTYRFDEVMRSQLKMRGIDTPLPSMSVKMAKFCTLNKTRTVHLRIAGAQQGEVHVFIRDGAFEIPAWRAEQGELNAMQWQVIHPRDDLSVLVMRTADMNPQNVEALIQKMFYA